MYRTVILGMAVCISQSACSAPPTAQSLHLNGSRSNIPETTGIATNNTQIPAVVLSGGDALYLLDGAGKRFGTIHVSGHEGAVAMDKQGDIYYDTYNQYSYQVLVFKPPYTGNPGAISLQGKGYARGVTVDWNTGVVAIATDAYAPYPHEHAAVWFFRHGETTPCAVVKQPSTWIWGTTGSFDSQGNFFIPSEASSGVNVDSISGECNAKTMVQYSPTLPYVLKLQFAQNQMVIEESTGFNNAPIVTFPHPSNGQIGKPIYTTTLNEIKGRPLTMDTLSSDGKYIWAADSFTTDVAEYPYPKGGAPSKIFDFYQVGGGAVNPPPLP